MKNFVRLVILSPDGIQVLEHANIVTNAFYELLAQGSSWQVDIGLAPIKMEPSTLSIKGSAFIRGAAFTGVPPILYVPENPPEGAYTQIAARFNPPSTTTKIETVALMAGDEVLAYVSLPSPVTQSTSTVIDAYYRVYHQNVRPAEILPIVFDRQVQNLFQTTVLFERAAVSAFPLDPALYTVGAGEVIATNTPTKYAAEFTASTDIEDNAGVLIKSSSLVGNIGTVTSDTLQTGHVQTVLGKRPSDNYFIDLSSIAAGTGQVTLSGEFIETVQGSLTFAPMPYAVRVNIKSGGAVGTAKYDVDTWPLFAPNMGSYQAVPIAVPALNTSTDSALLAETLLGKERTTLGEYQATSAYNESTVVIVFAGEALVYCITTASHATITGGWTAPHKSVTWNNRVYVGCRNTGVWSFEPGIDSVATAETSYGPNCYGLDIGNDGPVAVNSTGVAITAGGVVSVLTGITAQIADLSTVTGVVVNRHTPDNQMLIVQKPETQRIGVWFSGSGTALVAPDTLPASGATAKDKLHRYALGSYGYSSSSAYWAFVGELSPLGYGLFVLKFGTTDIIYVAAPTNYKVDYAGLFPVTFTAPTFLGSGSSERVVFNLASTFGGFGTFTATLDATAPTLVGNNIYVAAASGHTANSIEMWSATPMGDYLLVQTKTTSNVAHLIPRYGNPQSANVASVLGLARKHWGWNGTGWELGHSGQKNTHIAPEQLFGDFDIAFTGATPGAFAANDLYQSAFFDGVFKDNTMSLRMRHSFITFPNAPFTMALPVPGATSSTDTSMVLASSATVTQTGNVITFAQANDNQFAMYKAPLVGNWKIEILGSTLGADFTPFVIGIGAPQQGDYICGLRVETPTKGRLFWHQYAFGNLTATISQEVTISSLHMFLTLVGQTLELQDANGTLATATEIAVQYVNRVGCHPAWMNNSNGSFTGKSDITSFDQVFSSCNVPEIVITENGSAPTVVFAQSELATFVSLYDCKVELDGTEVVLDIDYTNNPPEPDKCAINQSAGLMVLNSADIGRTIAVNGYVINNSKVI